MSNGGLALVTKGKLKFQLSWFISGEDQCFFFVEIFAKRFKKIRACESYKRKKKVLKIKASPKAIEPRMGDHDHHSIIG